LPSESCSCPRREQWQERGRDLCSSRFRAYPAGRGWWPSPRWSLQ